jgi:N-(2-amino-2-carboxyethyl)-L-glutamate synthase
VPVISVPHAYNEDELYVDLQPIFGHSLFLKCEGFNFAGSIKLKAAAEMVEAACRDGMLTPHSILIESSSGNLGVALSMIAASKGHRFRGNRSVSERRVLALRRQVPATTGQTGEVGTCLPPAAGRASRRRGALVAACPESENIVASFPRSLQRRGGGRRAQLEVTSHDST